MVEMYCKLIIAKRRTLERVPDNLQAAVITRLKELGYDINGDKINGVPVEV